MRHVLPRPETEHRLTPGVHVPAGPVYVREPAFQAFSILRAGFTALPILAGLDKFFHVLVNWDQYVSPFFSSVAGGRVHGLMNIAGVVEIVAGLIVALRPRVGSAIVGLWLCGIIVNLLLIPAYFDIALRDFGLALGALSLFRLSKQYRT